MSRFNHKFSISFNGIIYRLLITLAAVTALMVLIPHIGTGMIEYKIGKPWLGNDIVAQNDFPLLKPDSVRKKEEQKVRENFKPVYELDAKMAKTQFNNVVNEYNDPDSLKFRKYLLDKLKKLYDAGIMTEEDFLRETKEKRQTFTVSLQRTKGEQRSLNAVYTPRSAYNYIMANIDTARYSKAAFSQQNIAKYIQPNLKYDKARSETQLKEEIKNITKYSGEVLKGANIVRHGDIVTEETALILTSMQEQNKTNKVSTIEIFMQRAGQAIFLLVLIVGTFFFLRLFRMDYLCNMRTLIFIILLLFSFPAITYVVSKWNVNPYVIPYCMVPIFLRVFTDSRTAFFVHIISVLLSAIAVSHPFEFIFIQISAGMVVIYSTKQMSSRSELFQTVMYIILCSLLCMLCFDLINGSFFTTEEVNEIDYIMIIANGLLLMISYLLLFPFERIFRFTSNVTMVELSNTNNEILRRLSEEAPGTFQHSLQVANLASEVARKIGAETQLVRTGALYHDIGKLENPIYFTENQRGVNPHDALSYAQSAQIIISHVHKGLELAEKHKLPPVIREFIATHHGAGMTRYFLIKQQNAHPNDVIDERPFTYPGPNPHTMEQAILMMADSVEAASRSLSDYTEESISTLVDKIVDGQTREGFFNLCPITFQDIATAKQVFKEKLMVIYHTRISYPELNKTVQTGSTSK